MAADSRSNAGVDHLMTVRKMTLFEDPGKRLITLLAAGNLAVTQSTVTILQEWISDGEDENNIMAARSMYRVARIIGRALREIIAIDGEHIGAENADSGASFLLGGQIKGGKTRLYQVYSAGNFIEASPETPFLQIGETKYGKPVLDRLVHSGMSLEEAAKCILVSYTSTLRSNVSVGLPVDLIAYETDSLRVTKKISVEQDTPYFSDLYDTWSQALQQAFDSIPNPDLDAISESRCLPKKPTGLSSP